MNQAWKREYVFPWKRIINNKEKVGHLPLEFFSNLNIYTPKKKNYDSMIMLVRDSGF